MRYQLWFLTGGIPEGSLNKGLATIAFNRLKDRFYVYVTDSAGKIILSNTTLRQVSP